MIRRLAMLRCKNELNKFANNNAYASVLLHSTSYFQRKFIRSVSSSSSNTSNNKAVLVDLVGISGKHFTRSECTVCDIQMTTKNNLVQHLISSKHAQQMIPHLNMEDHITECLQNDTRGLTTIINRRNVDLKNNVKNSQLLDAILANNKDDNNNNNKVDLRIDITKMIEKNSNPTANRYQKQKENNSKNRKIGKIRKHEEKDDSLARIFESETEAQVQPSNVVQDHVTEQRVRNVLNLHGKDENNISETLIQLLSTSNPKINQLRNVLEFECKHGTLESIEELLIKNKDICDIIMYTYAIQLCSRNLWWQGCLHIIKMIFNNNELTLTRNLFFYSVIFMCASENDKIIDVFPKCFDIMINDDGIKPDNIILNQLLKGCIQRGTLTLGNRIWQLFDHYNLRKNINSFDLMLQICGNGNDVSRAEEIFSEFNSNNNNNSNKVSEQIIHSFLITLSKCGTLNKFEKYKLSLSKKYGFPKSKQHNYIMLMTAYSRFYNGEKIIETFDEMMNKNIEPNFLSYSLLQSAYFNLQRENYNYNNKDKLDYYYKQVTDIIPQKILTTNEAKMAKKLKNTSKAQTSTNTNTNTPKLPAMMVHKMIRSHLHYYGQNRWYEAFKIIDKLIEDHKIGFWRWEKVYDEWTIDMHSLTIDLAVFGLRYVFVKDQDFILGVKHDLKIVTGVGKHRTGHSRDNDYSLKDCVKYECENWTPKLSLLNTPVHHENEGFVVVNKDDLKMFYDSVNDAKSFVNQTTDTCVKFHQGWTDVDSHSGKIKSL